MGKIIIVVFVFFQGKYILFILRAINQDYTLCICNVLKS